MKLSLTYEVKLCFTFGMDQISALDRAIKAAGTAKDLAAQIGVTPQALSQWRQVPPLRVLEIERLTGVSRHELRPDLYPVPDQETAA